MDLPKSFKPENKDLEKDIEHLLKKQAYNPKTVSLLLKSCEEFLENLLLESCEEFLEEIESTEWEEAYEHTYMIGKQLAEEIRYTKQDLKILSQEISKIGYKFLDDYLGFYLSALTNKVIKDRMTLKLNRKLKGVGAYLEDSMLTIEGSVGDNAGYRLKGGKLIIKGDAGDCTGYDAENGVIIIEGNAGDFTGACTEDGTTIIVKGDTGRNAGYKGEGKLIVHGNIKSLPMYHCGGEIYQGNKKIWP